MRILFLSNYYPPFELGGYEQLCRDVAIRLQDRGHEVAILISAYGGNNVQKDSRVYRLLRISPQYESRLSLAIQFFLQRRCDEAYANRCLHEICDFFDPAIFSIWNLQGLPRTLALEAEARHGTAVAYWLAGYSPWEPDEFWQYWNSPGKSQAAKLLKRVFGDRALALMRSEGKTVQPEMRHTAVVSHFMRQKNWQDGMLPRDRLTDYVSFTGWVPRERMSEIMRGHHVLLLPTVHQEAFARVVLEAMAAGPTVVAAATGGSSEVVQHDETGLLCQANDPAGLTTQISSLVQDPQLRFDLARGGQQVIIEKFSLRTIVDRVEDFLGKAVEEQGREKQA